MASDARALPLGRLRSRLAAAGEATPFVPTWSSAAALRAVRAAVVVPGMFAIADKLVGNLQMATFAAFGGFATLVLANFGGTRRDKLIAHTMLALAGSVLLIIGTAVTSTTLVAAIVTVPVVFLVFFAGVIGPNAASGATAALLAYVLPAASPGTLSMVPDRLAGWWLASVAGTAAVLAMSRTAPGNPLGTAADQLASALADELDAMLRGEATQAGLDACIHAKQELLARFTATPFRPTGLAQSDQALADSVEMLDWCTSLCVDSANERSDYRAANPLDREVLAAAAAVLRDAGRLLGGDRSRRPDLERLEQSRKDAMTRVHALKPGTDDFREQQQASFHAHAMAVTALVIGADSLLVVGLEDVDWAVAARIRWFGDEALGPGSERRLAPLTKYVGVAARHASLRSVWFINSIRGAVAIAVAVTVADLSSVQHGFWVVLGTLSVLRTSAASTGSTALRAITGTAVGFVIGGALLVAIGASSAVLWVALPIAVFVAAYAPGTMPFAVGQAAFTVVVAVLFNLLVPVGWKVGVVRIEDVAIGCAVSIVVGTLFWPHGASSVVGDDLADSFRAGADYLTEAVEWVSGLAPTRPEGAMSAITAGVRLNEALRGFITEQGAKHIRREELWRLVGGTMRLRLTGHAVSGLSPVQESDVGATQAILTRRARVLQSWFDHLADQLGRSRGPVQAIPEPPPLTTDPVERSAHSAQTFWLCENLDHLIEHLDELVGPAEHVAENRRRPWWR